MEDKTNYVKRTQKDYSLSFKHQVIFEVESGQKSTTSVQRKYGIQAKSTVVSWLRKFGTFDWENQSRSKMPKSAEAKIKDLLAKNKIQCSMTESYAPYANAVAERVNGILKQEFKIDCYGKI
ncbi:hypothetical protein EQP59_04770 [Ornithobacterium rhinotracheale]|uniref:Transposase n=1 Tax=Ornithobacterium rhinotracheale TaxID=28251 RepID=A0A410JRJ6_ORNRH|nr:hypothetical protein [Ornithobacterium rhinotracheale]QAR30701.1 hypothetical protein EQP59_04770 [Ornithobacterium rhinotracheale]